MMYYSAKRQFESTVSFDLIEALLAHDLQSGFRNDEGNLLVHRLGGWLERCRWEDDDELNGELNRQLAA